MSVTTPVRIRRRRTRGWRMPEGAVYVGRGSKWGNPFALRTREGLARVPAALNEGRPWEYEDRISADGMQHDFFHGEGRVTRCTVRYLTPAESVLCYRSVVMGDGWPVLHAGWYGLPSIDAIRAELAGRDLACWCVEGEPCHADWLLSVANSWDEPEWLTDTLGRL